MTGVNADKSFDGFMRQLRRDVDLLFRRLGASNSAPTEGTTAERDALFGVPGASVPAQVALANRNIRWLNTDTGWEESFYAPTGSAGLTARALVSGAPARWYPVAGSNLACTRIQGNGFQAIAAGAIVGVSFSATPLVNIGGFGLPAANQTEVPFAGFFSVAAAVYFSGGGAANFLNALVQTGLPGTTFADLISARQPGGAADGQVAVSTTSVLLLPGYRVALGAQSAVNNNIYGNGVNRATFLALKYDGPPFTNG